jgi:hypothetical protein
VKFKPPSAVDCAVPIEVAMKFFVLSKVKFGRLAI